VKNGTEDAGIIKGRCKVKYDNKPKKRRLGEPFCFYQLACYDKSLISKIMILRSTDI
jgi:hypothetical protein